MVNLTQRSMCLLLRCNQLIFLSIQIKFIFLLLFLSRRSRSAIRSSPVPLHKCDLIKLNFVAQNERSHAAISLAYATTEEIIAEFGTQGRFLMMTCFKLDTFEMSVIWMHNGWWPMNGLDQHPRNVYVSTRQPGSVSWYKYPPWTSEVICPSIYRCSHRRGREGGEGCHLSPYKQMYVWEPRIFFKFWCTMAQFLGSTPWLRRWA